MSGLFESFYFGILLCALAYRISGALQERTKSVLCNRLLVSVLIVLTVLKVFGIPYDSFSEGASVIHNMLGPATACLAVSIYSRRELLKKYWLPVLAGCTAGVAASVSSIYFMCRLFGLDRQMTVSLLPKSVTAPIASALAQANGGIASIAVAAVICTGMLGNLLAPLLLRLFRVREPIAVGLGLGACSHAVGTARALAFGETEGAMAGLAMGLCGLITAIAALLFPLL